MKKIQLTIPQPCHENWDQMTPRDRGRFCASCQKTVVDFSAMSDRQIAEFFKKPVSSVCGHFNQDQLNRDIDIARKRIPWIKYFFQFTLPAMLISAKATAQGSVVSRGDTVCMVPDALKAPKIIADKAENIVEGKVMDSNGNPIAYATVLIKGTQMATQADANGFFKLLVKLNSTLEVSSIGFESREIQINDFSKKNLSLNLVVLPAREVGFVIVAKPKKKNREITPIVKKIIDTAFKNFKVYPNPANNNSYLKIDLSKLEPGEFIISLINAEGEVLQTEEAQLSEKNKIVDFFLKDIVAGMYVIHVFNRKSAASWSEKIIVQ